MLRLYNILRRFGQFTLDECQAICDFDMGWLDCPAVNPWWGEAMVMRRDELTPEEKARGLVLTLLAMTRDGDNPATIIARVNDAFDTVCTDREERITLIRFGIAIIVGCL